MVPDTYSTQVEAEIFEYIYLFTLHFPLLISSNGQTCLTASSSKWATRFCLFSFGNNVLSKRRAPALFPVTANYCSSVPWTIHTALAGIEKPKKVRNETSHHVGGSTTKIFGAFPPFYLENFQASPASYRALREWVGKFMK